MTQRDMSTRPVGRVNGFRADFVQIWLLSQYCSVFFAKSVAYWQFNLMTLLCETSQHSFHSGEDDFLRGMGALRTVRLVRGRLIFGQNRTPKHSQFLVFSCFSQASCGGGHASRFLGIVTTQLSAQSVQWIPATTAERLDNMKPQVRD